MNPPVPQAPGDGDGDAARELTGIIENIVYRSEESGYTVCRVRAQGSSDLLTLVGKCPAVWVGETVRATGEWTHHKTHGTQFQADSMQCIVPTSAKGIERYLASGMLRGIGKVTAKRLVDHFGEDTLRVIEEESARLQEVDGIGPHRRRMIKESWGEQKAVRDIMIFLQSHGVGTAQSARIYKQYGRDAIAIISQNPYRLCADVWGIGFKTADAVAMSVGVPKDSEVRAQAGLVYTLDTYLEQGHCYTLEPDLLLRAQELLDMSVERLADALNHQVAAGHLVREDGRVYNPGIHRAELAVAEAVRRIRETPAPFEPIDLSRAIAWTEKKMEIQFAPRQAEAIRMALTSKISIITGGPGVGKTTIIRALTEVFSVRKLRIALAAPTGRASKRMEEATGTPASTLHRLLKVVPHTGTFEHGPDNPLEGDIFILDEMSMVDISLMYHFLSAMRPECCLVLVGDTDQLPSVGPGNVLKDLIESGQVPCIALDTIFRQQQGSLIVRNAHHVNHGEALELPDSSANSDFFFIAADDPDSVLHNMLELVTRRIPTKFGFDPMDDIQVLTPMRRNQLGADNLNVLLQEALNPRGEEVQRFGRKYRDGDRVMQIRNNYDKAVFNGDIGRIVAVDSLDQTIAVDFDGVRIEYEFSELDELVHAYACSIHKSQGSEYPAVVLLLATQHYKLLQRNLLYTGITRGKRLVCLVGSRKAVHIAIKNNEIRMRRTTLRPRVAGERPGRIVAEAVDPEPSYD